jgi:hypothetical protein
LLRKQNFYISSLLGERIKVRGKAIIISTLTPALSRQRERGSVYNFHDQ